MRESQGELKHMDTFQKYCSGSLGNVPVKALLRWLNDFSSFSSPLMGCVCQKISAQSPDHLPQRLYSASVWKVYLMWVVNYMVSGLAKADW